MTGLTTYTVMQLIGIFMIGLPVIVFLLCCVEDIIRYSSKTFFRICWVIIATIFIYYGD